MKQPQEPDFNINVKNDKEIPAAVDQLDEVVLRDEIISQSRSNQWFYTVARTGEFKIGVAGIRELHRRRGGITTPVEKLIIKEGKADWDMVMEAIDAVKSNSNIGMYIQSKFKVENNKPPVADPYAKQIGFGKTYRNALEPLIEQKWKDELLKEFKAIIEKEKKKGSKKKTKKKPVKKVAPKVTKKPVKADKPKKKKVQPTLFDGKK